MNRKELVNYLGEERVKEIEEKARSFIHGSKINWKAFDSYLRELANDSNVQVIDIKTGELLHPFFMKIPEILVVREAFFEKKDMVENGKGKDERGHYFNMVRETNIGLEGQMTNSDRSKVLLLAREQFKRYTFEDKARWFTSEELCEIWGINESTCKNIRSRLKQHGILESKKIDSSKKEYSISKKFIYIGKSDSGEFAKIYYKKLDDVIKKIQSTEKTYMKRTKKPLKMSALGTLQGILPYFHKEFSYLVKNPSESMLKDIKDENGLRKETIIEAYRRESNTPPRKRKIKYITKRQLRIILSTSKSMDAETLDRHLNVLQAAGAIKIDTTNNVTRYLVHPYLLFCQDVDLNDEYLQFLKDQFGMHEE